MKIAIAASAGGHLTEVLQVQEAWKGKERFFVSDCRENAKALARKEKVYFVSVPRRNPLRLLENIFQSFKIAYHEKPNMVISTGADVAVPFCLWAKLFGAKIVFIESLARINEPSLSGKILYPFADLFLVQWKENLEFFPRAEFRGAVV
ncbi:MAG: PssD/Cps14F family polysaccharide biosynthesis glycosyltransferase [Candidatus Diapherotrites archaeon]